MQFEDDGGGSSDLPDLSFLHENDNNAIRRYAGWILIGGLK